MNLRGFSKQDAELFCGQDDEIAKKQLRKLIQLLGPIIDETIRAALKKDGWSTDALATFLQESRQRIWRNVWATRTSLDPEALGYSISTIAADVFRDMIRDPCHELVNYTLTNGCTRTQRRAVLSEAYGRLTPKQQLVLAIFAHSPDPNWAATAAANPECPYFDDAAPTLPLDQATIHARQNALRVGFSRAATRFELVVRDILFGDIH